MIRFEKAELRLGNQALWSHASFTIHPGWKVGLTGKNGTGKTSLFRLLQGEHSVEQGSADIPRTWKVATVKQETPASEASALDYVLNGDEELRLRQAELRKAEQENNGEAIAKAHADLDAIDAYRAESRAAKVLSGLGFSNQQLKNRVESFSGGWRMRLNLAQALCSRADVLLLDEPTNHLDLDAVIWLERWLKNYDNTLIMVSHDREFLDATIQHVLHIENATVTYFSGNFTAAERRRYEQQAAQQAAFEGQQAKIAHMQAFVDRFRAQATKAKQAQSRLKALQRLVEIAPIQSETTFRFTIPTAEKQPNPILRLEEAALSHAPDLPPSLKHLNFRIGAGDRIGLLGRNGAGKSSLIRWMADQKQPQSGESWFSPECRIGYFAQHQVDELIMDHTPVDHLKVIMPKATEQQMRDILGGFLFQGDRAFEPVKHFSGGEKARLALAMIVSSKPNLLLMDEPTNHLDMTMREALAVALQNYNGALIIVSHDRGLLRTVVDKFWLIENQQLQPFSGDLEDYAAYLKEQAGAGDINTHSKSDKQSSPSNDSLSAEDKKTLKRQQAEIRKQLSPLKNKIDKLEKQQKSLSQELKKVQDQLSDSALYTDDRKADLQHWLTEDERIKKAINDNEEQWLETEEALETLQQKMTTL